MAQVNIRINGNPGPELNFALANPPQPVTFSNLGDGTETTFSWQVVDAPTNGVVNAGQTNQATFTFTPSQRGTYLVRLTANPNTPGAVSGTTILAIRHTNIRIPAVREQVEAGSDGWGDAMQEALLYLDNLITNAVVQYGSAAELSNVTSAAEAAGVLNKAARADHKHDINVASPADIGSLGETGGLGFSSALARADHRHGTVPQDPGTEMGLDISGWKLHATDILLQQRLLTQGIVVLAQSLDMSAVDPQCHILLCDSTNGTIVVTLPLAGGTIQNGTDQGRVLRIKNIGTGRVSIAGSGGQLIDGAASTIIKVQGGSIDLVSDGANWWRLGSLPVQTQHLHWNGRLMGTIGGGNRFFEGPVQAAGTSAVSYQMVPGCTMNKLTVRLMANSATAGSVAFVAYALKPDGNTSTMGSVSFNAAEVGVKSVALTLSLDPGALVYIRAESTALIDSADVAGSAVIEYLTLDP